MSGDPIGVVDANVCVRHRHIARLLRRRATPTPLATAQRGEPLSSCPRRATTGTASSSSHAPFMVVRSHAVQRFPCGAMFRVAAELAIIDQHGRGGYRRIHHRCDQWNDTPAGCE